MVIPAADLTIVQQIAAGDQAAETSFDQKYRGRLELIARKSGLSGEDCRDLAQEVLAAAFSKIRNGGFRGDSTLATWLNAILRAKMVDHWRTSRRNPLRLNVENPPDRVSAVDLAQAPPIDQDARISVHQVLETLPALHRLVLVLNQFGGLTTDEIGIRLKRPAGTVGRILWEAKDMFRRRLSGEDSRTSQRLLKE